MAVLLTHDDFDAADADDDADDVADDADGGNVDDSDNDKKVCFLGQETAMVARVCSELSMTAWPGSTENDRG